MRGLRIRRAMVRPQRSQIPHTRPSAADTEFFLRSIAHLSSELSKTMRSRAVHRTRIHGRNAAYVISADPQEKPGYDPRKRFGEKLRWLKVLPSDPAQNAGWIRDSESRDATAVHRDLRTGDWPPRGRIAAEVFVCSHWLAPPAA